MLAILRSRAGAVARAAATGALALTLCLPNIGQVSALPGEQSLKLFNIHTKERATIVFKRNGRYVQSGIRELQQFLRDWRRDEPTKMDPLLFDLVWEVYRQSGSRDYIHVVSAYRSPATNSKLRRRSKGVAKNSLHTRGRAMDFYLPDVKLAKLRALGLKLHIGGVGYYPKSGAPFVHMDTGNVRHWPRMSRKQLMAVFPNGKTMHVPSDGKPLANYALAKAESDARRSGRRIAVANVATPPTPARRTAEAPAQEPMVITTATPPVPEQRPVGVAVATYDDTPAPLPRLSPRRSQPSAVASVTPPNPRPAEPVVAPPVESVIASFDTAPVSLAPEFDFTAPTVPANLAAAMAERDQSRRRASLPIAPTSVVATIDFNRPLRAQTITAAVLRDGEPARTPQVLAFAPQDHVVTPRPVRTVAATSGVPLPRANPQRRVRAGAPATRSIIPDSMFETPELVLTTLDTHGLRSWIGPGSTRQRGFAVLTMPDVRQVPDLIRKPRFSYAASFTKRDYPIFRTNQFHGPLVRQPAIVMLAAR